MHRVTGLEAPAFPRRTSTTMRDSSPLREIFRADETSDGFDPLAGARKRNSAASGATADVETRMSHGNLAAAEPLRLSDLISSTDHGIASRVLAKTSGGNVTLFAFDAGEGLSEHTAPFDALVVMLEGTMSLTIGGRQVEATPGTIVRMPANIPHALDATTMSRLLLVMLREPKP
jgi:quercetin dioxygenase-like cupin family protein